MAQCRGGARPSRAERTCLIANPRRIRIAPRVGADALGGPCGATLIYVFCSANPQWLNLYCMGASRSARLWDWYVCADVRRWIRLVLRGAMWASRPTRCDRIRRRTAHIAGWICRVVEDADPYDGNAPAKNRRGRRPDVPCGTGSFDCSSPASDYTSSPLSTLHAPLYIKKPAHPRCAGFAVGGSIRDYTMPCAIMASATFRKPATFAPSIRLPGWPHSTEAS